MDLDEEEASAVALVEVWVSGSVVLLLPGPMSGLVEVGYHGVATSLVALARLHPCHTSPHSMVNQPLPDIRPLRLK